MASKNIKGITIEIGGDTTGLDKALKNVEKGSNKAKSELKEVDRALKNAPDSAVLWAQKQELLTKAIEESKKKLELLENAQEQVEKQFQNKEIGEEQYRAFQREVENAQAQLNHFREELDDTRRKAEEAGDSAGNAGDDIDKLGDDAENAGEDVEDLGESAETAGNKAEESGNGGFAIFAGAVAAAAGAAAGAVKTADELSQSYDTLVKKTGATGESLEALKENANNVFADLPTDIDSATTAVGEVNTRFAATGKELEALSKKFIQFSEINDTDLNTSIGTADKIMEQWSVDIKDIDGLLGMLTKKAQDTGISTDTLMSSVQENGATFKELGLSLDESINLLAQFEANGVNADTAITGLRKGIKSATDNGKTLDEALELTISDIKNAAGETEALTAAQELFGTKGAAEMANAIREGRFNLSGLSEDMSRYKSTVSTTYEATVSPMEKLKTVGNDAKLMVGEIGDKLTEALLPTAEKMLPKIRDGSDWLIKNLPKITDTAKKILPLVEGIGAGFVAWKAVNGISKGIGLAKQLGDTLKTTSLFASATTTGVVGLVAALAVGTGSYIYAAQKAHEAKLEEIFKKGTEEARNLADEINESSEKMNELKESAKSQIETDFSEIYKTENLYKELQDLVDENGNVKSGYEDRVNYIRNELSEATGIEIGLVDGQIQKYQELQSTIEETLNKQRAQTMLNAYSEAYNAAIIDNQSASKKIMQNEDIIAESETAINKMYGEAYKIAAANNKSIEHRGDFTYSNYDNWADIFNDQQWEQLHVAEENIRTAQSSIDSIGKQIEDNKYIIQQYEKAEGAFYDNKYSLAQGYASSIDDLDRAALSNNEKNLNERQDALKKSVDTAIRDYETRLKYGLTEGNEEIQESLAAIIKQCQESGMTMGEILSSGIVDELGQIDGFDSSKLIAFGRDYLGLTLGDSIGFMSRVALQPHIDAMRNEFTSILDGLSNLKLSADTIVSSTVNRFRNIVSGIPMMASGGTLHSGSAIVAEAGPELIEIMNGGVRVTPLTDTARNTAVGTANGQNVFYNTYNVTVEKISSDYDVKVLSQRLAAEQRKIESGKGK